MSAIIFDISSIIDEIPSIIGVGRKPGVDHGNGGFLKGIAGDGSVLCLSWERAGLAR